MSTKKTSQRSEHKVDAVGDRLGEVGIGAELLAEADEDQRLNESVYVASHRVALRGRENPVCACLFVAIAKRD